eukprot:gb/GECH01014498.1/.p1 GENE.gb/GECH01014498.1/~~gb/GECH01014498.1/.p1  ORF type:complete len:308 (+),score=77.96 gb/GECH01014498.1/:1-924(+)
MNYEQFYKQEPEPSFLQDYQKKIEGFVKQHKNEGRRVVLIMSGGTEVPLEKNTVRSVTNFSSGNRGSSSAEAFLRKNYAVIFIYHQNSLQPFLRLFHQMKGNELLNLFQLEGETVSVKTQEQNKINHLLKEYHHCMNNQLLLSLPFCTITEYLFLLKMATVALCPLKSKALIYLPAAVSDFYLPNEMMSEHKIQSGSSEKLQIELHSVPKVLGAIKSEWNPYALLISFKLETDEDLLISKAQSSVEKYGVDIVVANMLQNYKYRVTLLLKSKETIPLFTEKPKEYPIEDLIVDQLDQFHTQKITQDK